MVKKKLDINSKYTCVRIFSINDQITTQLSCIISKIHIGSPRIFLFHIQQFQTWSTLRSPNLCFKKKRNNEPMNVDKPIYFWVLSLNIQNPTWHSIWNRDPSNSSLFHTSVRLWGWLTVLSARTGQLSSTTTTRITKILVASLCIKEAGWF